MTQRTEREMAAILTKFDEQLGRLDTWSTAALTKLDEWIAELEKRRMTHDPELNCNCADGC